MSDTNTLPTEYDNSDGWDESRALNYCPHCETVFSGNGGILGPVYNQDGTRFETYLDTDPNNGPWFCQDCWTELEANRKAAENKSLGEFA